MKNLIIILALLPAILFSQTVDFSLTDGTNVGISLSEIKFVIDGDGSYTLRYGEALSKAEITGNAVDLYNSHCNQFGLFISTGDTLVINNDFVSKIYDDNNGGSIILTKRFRYSFQTTTPYADAMATLAGCSSWPENNTYYISVDGGNDATAVKNDPSRPWKTGAAFQGSGENDNYYFSPGVYHLDTLNAPGGFFKTGLTYGTMVPIPSAYVTFADGVDIVDEKVRSLSGFGVFGDEAGAFAANHIINGPSTNVYLPDLGQSVLLTYYNTESNIDVNLGDIVQSPFLGGTGADWNQLISLQTRRAKMKFKDIYFNGQYTLIAINYPDTSSILFEADNMFLFQDSSRATGATALYNAGNSSGRTINHRFLAKVGKIQIDNAKAKSPDSNVLKFPGLSANRGMFSNSQVEFDVETINWVNDKFTTLGGASVGAGGLYESGFGGNNEVIYTGAQANFDSVYYKVRIGKANAKMRGLFMLFEGTYNQGSLVDLDWGNIVSRKAVISMRGTNLNTGSIISIHCDYCESIEDVAIGFDGTIDASSTLILSGTFKTSAAGKAAIVLSDAGAGRIILKDVTVINDGTVAAIQSDVPQTVIVSGVHDVNTIILDPDITFVKHVY